MPELPEVETVRRSLSERLSGQTIARCDVRKASLRWPIAADFAAHCEGQTLTEVGRRSKYLLLNTEQGILLAHLGMTGSFAYDDSPQPLRTHDHVLWTLASGATLRYHDPRRFGSLHWLTGHSGQHALLDSLGPEPLTDDFYLNDFYERVHKRGSAIKTVIMDNHVVVGVGNIYASEALFLAGIHPDRAANRISKVRINQLLQAIKNILSQAIAAGGTSFSDFVGVDGSLGAFQLSTAVYGRAGKACRQCAEPIQQMKHSGRATFFCAQCQR
jgi:formamidopyrimidine-DNA glycosylase